MSTLKHNKPDARPTIILAVSQGFESRYLLKTNILSRLLEQDAKIVILSPNAEEEYFRKEFESKGCIVEQLDIDYCRNFFDSHPLQNIFKQIRQQTLNSSGITRFLDDKNVAITGNPGFVLKTLGKSVRFISRIIRKSKFLRLSLLKLEMLMYSPPLHADIFDRYKPHLVVLTGPGYWLHDTYLLRAARKRRIKTLVAMLSWDNPASKGYPGAKPDKVLAWTEVMKDELTEYADIPRDIISVAGVASFDIYTSTSDFDRAAYLKLKGWQPEAKIILFATKSPSAFPNMDIVKILAQAVNEGRFPSLVHIIVRMHPIYYRRKYSGDHVTERDFAELDKLRLECPAIKISLPEICSETLHLDMPQEEMTEISNLIRSADVVVSMFSTINMEGALADKPLVNVAFDGLKKNSRATGYRPIEMEIEMPHIQRFLSRNGCLVANDPEELVNHVVSCLNAPDHNSEARKQLVENECGPFRGKAGDTIGDIIFNEGLSAMQMKQD